MSGREDYDPEFVEWNLSVVIAIEQNVEEDRLDFAVDAYDATILPAGVTKLSKCSSTDHVFVRVWVAVGRWTWRVSWGGRMGMFWRGGR